MEHLDVRFGDIVSFFEMSCGKKTDRQTNDGENLTCNYRLRG